MTRLPTGAGGPHRVVLCVDTGTDDALAIWFALAHPELSVEAIVAVHGNASLDVVVDNTLRVVDLAGANVPVFVGRAEPWARRRSHVELPSRSAYAQALALPRARSRPQDVPAAGYLTQAGRARGGELTLVSTAPLSTLAEAVSLDPTILARFRAVVVLGGSHAIGNVTPSAEFNVWADPEGARAVLRAAAADMTLITLDTSQRALVDRDVARRLRSRGGRIGEAAAGLIEARIDAYSDRPALAARGAAPIHDAFAVATLVERALVRTSLVHVDVETSGELTTGRTVIDVDRRGREPPNVRLARPFRVARFAPLFAATLERLAGG